MAGHAKRDDQPWYRTTTATFTAGGLGAVLLAGLVFAVVQFSDDWSSPGPPVFTTAVSPPPTPSTETDRRPFVGNLDHLHHQRAAVDHRYRDPRPDDLGNRHDNHGHRHDNHHDHHDDDDDPDDHHCRR